MANQKVDPISQKYFKPLERAELVEVTLFYLSAAISLAIPLIDRTATPKMYDYTQIVFLILVIALSITSFSIRLYFSPRAQDCRLKDFLSHAYNTSLSPETTDHYYTTNEETSQKRLAAQALENSLYSKNTISEMVTFERIKVVIYFLLWFIAISNRSTDLAILALIAQIIFSEHIVLKWLRSEWLRRQFESVFDGLFQLFMGNKNDNQFEVRALQLMGKYETSKAIANITLSSKVFKKIETESNAEWATVRKRAGI